MWNTILVVAGYILGDNWEDVENVVGYLQYVVILAAVLGAAWFLWSKLRGRSRADRRVNQNQPRVDLTCTSASGDDVL